MRPKHLLSLLASLPPIVIATSAPAQDTSDKETTPETPPPPAPATSAAPIATASAAPATPAAATPRTGVRFRFDAKLASGLLGFTGFVPQMVPGITFDRWSIGLGLGFLRGSLGSSTAGSVAPGTEVSATLVSFAPTVVFDVLRSADDHVALYALASLAPAFLVIDTGSSGPCGSPGSFVLGYQAALGARYAFHPQFMLGLEAGPTGQITATSIGCSTPGSSDTTVGLHGIYGALVGTFVGP